MKVCVRACGRTRDCLPVTKFESKYINLAAAINVTFSSSFSNYI